MRDGNARAVRWCLETSAELRGVRVGAVRRWRPPWGTGEHLISRVTAGTYANTERDNEQEVVCGLLTHLFAESPRLTSHWLSPVLW